MIIDLHDNTASIKANYLQSLVLLYLPCESFSLKNAENDDKHFHLTVETNDISLFVDLSLSIGDAREHVLLNEVLSEEPLRLQVKKIVGKAFLMAGNKIFGYTPPWGTVTGIRPAKLAADHLSRMTEDATKSLLTGEYFVLPERADLCIRTAQNEKRLVENLADNTCSLYISIPFCPSKCRYCSFVSMATPRLLALIPEYFEALLVEISAIASTIHSLGLKLSTVYVGGGTPAVLSAEQILRLSETLYHLFDMNGVEYTIEAGRPDCITREKLKAIYDGGASRVSINTQTANNDILAAVGRKHTFEDYVHCMELARQIGIGCINTDLIAGLPGESTESFCESLEKVKALLPENLTVHAFTLKRSSEYKMTNSASVDAASRAALDMITYSSKSIVDAGYEPYYMYRQKNTVGNLENTGFAKPGFACLYNIYMMGEYHTVFAAGAGAVTKYVSRNRQRIERVFCPKYPYEYLDKTKYTGFDAAFAHHFYNNLY